LLESLKSDPRPQRVALQPELGLTLERMIAPVLAGQDLYGYIWIIAGKTPFDSVDFLAVERAAHIAALILSREQSVYAAEQRLKASLVENLMDPSGTQSPFALQEIMQQFGLRGGCRVILLEQQNTSSSSRIGLLRIAEEVLTDKNLSGTALEWGGRLLVLANPSGEIPAEEAARFIVEKRASRGGRLAAGISAPVSEPGGVRAAYQQALQALQTGLSLGRDKPGVWSYERLGYLPWLHSFPAEMRTRNPYRQLVDEINRYDQQNTTNFLSTLESYLNNHQNQAGTARDLFIHRNSLLKRLTRIQELWKLDFEDPYFMLNLHLAIVEQRLGDL
jgi:sugar diacid utilization regulator